MRGLLIAAMLSGCAHVPVANTVTEDTGTIPNDAPAAPDASAERTVAIIKGAQPLMCTLTRAGLGGCFFEADQCSNFRKLNPDSTECAWQNDAACFSYTDVTSGKRLPLCAPSLATCEKLIDLERSSPDVQDVDDDCGIYRFTSE